MLGDVSDELMHLAYCGAEVFLFPSLAEGFGWPIAEAMACGCPVITTNEAPMTEVAGAAGVYVSRRPFDKEGTAKWAIEVAHAMHRVITCSHTDRNALIGAGLENVKKFNCKTFIDRVEAIYQQALPVTAA